MTAYQRAVLAELGVSVWARQAASTQYAPVAFWRDQQPVTPAAPPLLAQVSGPDKLSADELSAEELPAGQSSSATDPSGAILTASIAQARPLLSFSDLPLEPVSEPLPVMPAVEGRSACDAQLTTDAEVAESPVNEPKIGDPIASDPVSAEALAPTQLRWQVALTPAWALIVPSEALQDTASLTLWQNLTKALGARPDDELIWPLGLHARWQKANGLQAAVAGFVFRLQHGSGRERRIGVLGDVPDRLVTDAMERLPSIAELLADPRRKRSLWALLTAQEPSPATQQAQATQPPPKSNPD